MKKIALFILGYKGYPYIRKGYLDKILQAVEYDKENKYVIIYLDNASRDGTIRYLLENYKKLDILLSPENYLYVKSINLGLQYIYNYYNPDYYLLVDIDNPCENNCYYELIGYANSHIKTGIVQPQVRCISDKTNMYSCGHEFTDDYMCYPRKQIPKNIEEIENQQSVSISSTLIKKEVFLECGLLDEIFRIYYESSDLSFRARKKGFIVGCALNAIAYNEGTEIFDESNYYQKYFMHRNKVLFWEKHNEVICNKILDNYKQIIYEYRSKYKGNNCIFDAVEHAKIKASVDALDIIKRGKDKFVKEPKIDNYSNLDLVVIQKVCTY